MRENITSETGFTAVKFQNAVVKFINKCSICSIIRGHHPDRGKGTRIPLTLGGKPYDSISCDTISLGQIRMTRGAKNVLRKNLVLAITCLNSGHMTLEPIANLTPHSVGSALWRTEERYHTRICRIYSDNHPSLRESSLGSEFEDLRNLRVALDDVIQRTEGVIFCTNPSYNKCRKWIERNINDIRGAIEQFTVINRTLILNWEESLNLMTAICARYNNFPYTRYSLLSPASFLNPHAALYDVRFEIEKGSITESMKLLMEEVAKRALESVILDGGLERGPNLRK